jgi:hypothetical protein
MAGNLLGARPDLGRLTCLCKTVVIFVGFEIFTAVVMKSIIFWDITACSPLKVRVKK